ncbi:hypothetical protein NPIL_437241 [Nephila pilipes]|uniref:Uncharacterized protein n=1 Tax=Nephila pilipes TaxID=299642 RepID=A0A8X6Q9U0_NEPPI|nr:hypothetical protein NPIL_437241 [Nephila pilipes]
MAVTELWALPCDNYLFLCRPAANHDTGKNRRPSFFDVRVKWIDQSMIERTPSAKERKTWVESESRCLEGVTESEHLSHEQSQPILAIPSHHHLSGRYFSPRRRGPLTKGMSVSRPPLEEATVPKDVGEERIQLLDTGQRKREFIERSAEVALKIRSGRY